MNQTPYRYSGRVGLQQRVLPEYRLAFVDMLADSCSEGLQVFAGQPRSTEAIVTGRRPEVADWIQARNRHWFGNPLYLLRQPGLLGWLDEWRPDVLILEANPRYLDNWRALRWVRQHRIAVVGWGLGVPALSAGFAPLAWLWQAFLKQFDGLIAYSSKGASEYQAVGMAPDRVFVALNAAAAGSVEAPTREVAEDRPLHLLFVGRLQERKGVERLLKACSRIGSSRVELRIVGDGPDRTRLESLAERHLPAAEFMGDQRGQALSESFAWADLFVLPGTGGLAIQQAMAHGLPVVVGEGDGTQADLVRPDNGWLVEGESVEALQSTLESALARVDELPEMGQASAALVQTEINLGSMVQTFLNAIQAVTDEAV